MSNTSKALEIAQADLDAGGSRGVGTAGTVTITLIRTRGPGGTYIRQKKTDTKPKRAGKRWL